MFDNIGRVAEKVATSISRRRFLGTVGRWAVATAVGLAGMLTSTGTARSNESKKCCLYGTCFPVPCPPQCVNKFQACPISGGHYAIGAVLVNLCVDCSGL